MKIILILSIIPIAILACADSGDSGDNSPPIIHHVVTPEPTPSGDFPEVPEGFPLTPVWLQENFYEQFHSDHVTMYRVLIELWNQGDHDFVNAILNPTSGKVYPLYPDVLYVEWHDSHISGHDGTPMKHVNHALGTRDTVRLRSDLQDKIFTEEEMEEIMAGEGAFMANYPGLKLVDYNKAGYKPKTVLVDYCNQPGNRARVPYCR